MTTTVTPAHTDLRQEWFEFEDAIYLNMAANGPMPKVSLRAAQASLEWRKFPHRLPDSSFIDIPNKIRASIANLIGGKPEEIAITTGASGGMSAVAYGLSWKPGDEIVIPSGEFPLQYTTWKPMEERENVKVKIVAQREKFLTEEDLIEAITPRTRIVSASLVRFNDGSMLDARRVADACHAQGALLFLDVSQSCGAIPLDVAELGVDFMVCAAYKWLLGPYGTGFLWAKKEHIEKMRSGPFYWMASVEDAHQFSALSFQDLLEPVKTARQWDAAETASFLNLSALDASLDLVLRISPQTVAEHNHKLIEFMYERLPKDRCIPASPLDRARRGPYGCFVARSPEKTAVLYEKLKQENIIVSLREGNLRVSPYLFNTERDIDRLISVITV